MLTCFRAFPLELALRARIEPRAAFEVLFERHRSPLYNFLLVQGADFEDTPREERREETVVLENKGENSTFIRDIVIP